ncbi:MAG TPA: DMT family transporter [Burkholderiaceae bacterium]|nr:DMT family transporter [Burkholderiaceae bacterium]
MSTPAATAAGRSSGIPWLLAAAVFWGANVPLTAQLFDTFDPFFLSLLRIVLAATVIGGLMLAIEGLASFRATLPLRRWAGMSLAMASFYWLYNLSLAHTHPITASAIAAGSPVYAAILLKLMVRAPLARGFVGAALLTIIGGGIAVAGRAIGSNQPVSLEGGEPLMVISLFCWTLYSYLAQRGFPPGVSQLQRTFVSMTGALVWLAIGWGVMRLGGWVGPANLQPGPQAILYLVITSVFATAVGSVAWNIGVNRSGLAVGSLWQNTVPVFSVLIAIGFGMQPTVYQVGGGLLVIAGVLYMQWRQRPVMANRRR